MVATGEDWDEEGTISTGDFFRLPLVDDVDADGTDGLGFTLGRPDLRLGAGSSSSSSTDELLLRFEEADLATGRAGGELSSLTLGMCPVDLRLPGLTVERVGG